MQYVRALLAMAALAVVWSSPAIAGGDGNGFYIRGGAAMGWNNIPSGTNGGFEAGAGIRLAPALAIEGNFVFVTGGGTDSYLGTVDAKLYPFMITASDSNGLLQPYVRVGIGGGGASLAAFSTGAFVARFGGGLDLMITDKLGAYGDVSYFLPAGSIALPAIGSGQTTLSFGGILKF
jgi:hypothetical protein